MAAFVIVVAVLLTLAAATLLALRALGLNPARLATALHALGEARHRSNGVLAEFAARLRLGS